MKLTITMFLAATFLAPGLATAAERTLTAFDGKDSLRWQAVNDGVMGGLSRGDASPTESQTLLFAGEISLENNGGFSSIRTRPQDLKLDGYDGLEFRVRGDGRTYKFSLRTRGTSSWIAYWADFETEKDEWTTVRIPFAKWVPTTFGRKLAGPRLVPAAINSIGFMLYDKKAGPFRLEIDSIAAFKASARAAPETKRDARTIIETARSAGSFKTLLAAAEAAGLVEALSAGGPLTVFAPSDAAFEQLPEGALAGLLKPENKNALRTVLLHHVVKGDVSLLALYRNRVVTPLSGQRLDVRREGALIRVGTAAVTTAGLRCDNGVIHVVDTVILPEMRDLATVAAEAKTFNTLVAAAKAAGLFDALTGAAELTVFAPSDAAFARLPKGTVESLLEPANKETLKRILLHHVVEGRVHADAAAAAGKTSTAAGTTLTFGYANGLQVSGTRIMMPDVPARNGVIHIIENVLLPPTPASAERTASGSGAKTAMKVIEFAIDSGVDLFNSGNAEDCCAVYELAVTALLGIDEKVFSDLVREKLGASLRSKEDAIDRAWTLRRALDSAYAEARAGLDR